MGSDDTPSISVRAIRDTGKLFGSQLVVGLCAVFFSAWLNRLLSKQDLALWPLCVGLGGFIAAFSSGGMGDTFVRLVPGLLAQGQRDEARRILRTGLLLNVGAASLLVALMYYGADTVARLLLHDEAATPLVRPMLLAGALIGLRDRLSWALRATQRFGKQALITLLTDTARTPLAVGLFFACGQSVRGVILALTIISGVACALTLFWVRDFLGGSGFYPVGRLLRLSFPFYGVSIMGFVSERMNYLLIGSLASTEALASYFVADSIVAYVQALNAFAMGAIAPKLAEKSAQDRQSAGRVFSKCTRYLFLVLLPLHVLVAVLATPMVRLYGGAQYEEYGYILQLLCLAVLLEAVSMLQRTHVQVLANPWRLLLIQGVQGAVTFGLLMAFIPPLAATGAALVRGVVAVVLIVVTGLQMRGVVPMRYDLRAMCLALAASGVAALAAYGTAGLTSHHIAEIAVGSIAGFVVYVLALIRRLQPSDVDLLVQLIPTRVASAPRRTSIGTGLSRVFVRPPRSA